jgi:hypothetical protein
MGGESDVFGGADRDRTDDLLNAIQALSQLSYGPTGTQSVPKEGVFVNASRASGIIGVPEARGAWWLPRTSNPLGRSGEGRSEGSIPLRFRHQLAARNEA